MREELEEGHFDTAGHYHWKKEKEVRDGWLDNIDWVKVKGRPEDKYKVHKDGDDPYEDSDSDDGVVEEKFDIISNYKEILQHMKPKETIAKTIQRLGKNLTPLIILHVHCSSIYLVYIIYSNVFQVQVQK